MLNFILPNFFRQSRKVLSWSKNVLFWHIFVAHPKLQPNLLKEVHYALVAHANFQQNSCARINYKKRNHALSEGHFKHITNIQMTQLAQQSTVISSVSNSQTFKYSRY